MKTFPIKSKPMRLALGLSVLCLVMLVNVAFGASLGHPEWEAALKAEAPR